MFVVEVVAALTTVLFVRDDLAPAAGPGFSGQIALWLWFTVLFANFAEAMAEGRGKAQADTLRRRAPRPRRSCWSATTGGTRSKPCRPSCEGRRPRARRGRRHHPRRRRGRRGHRHGRRVGDHRRVRAGHPREPAATARPSPAARACCPTGSSCASPPKPGSTFLDRMIALVEGARRQKTPNEIALNILLAG
jgi:K+-transporting ATPase ATPase B chain